MVGEHAEGPCVAWLCVGNDNLSRPESRRQDHRQCSIRRDSEPYIPALLCGCNLCLGPILGVADSQSLQVSHLEGRDALHISKVVCGRPCHLHRLKYLLHPDTSEGGGAKGSSVYVVQGVDSARQAEHRLPGF